MYCAVCLEFLEDHRVVKLPCSCTHCSDCLTNWIVTQSKELHYQTYEKIQCMNTHCRQPFKAEEVILSLTQEQQDIVNHALFDVYLKKSEDIRMCPNSTCSYAGIIDTSQPCVDSLECALCENKWREKVHLTAKEKVKEFFGENNTKRSEILCELWEEMWTRRCPSCGVSIEKSGGCDHMTCRKCQFEFCWLCTQKHKGHNKRFCAAAFVTKLMILLIAVVNILWMLGVVQIVLGVIAWTIRFTVKCAVLNALVVGSYFFTVVLKKRKRRLQFVMATLLVLLMFLIYYFKLWFSLIAVGIIESICLGLVTIYEKRMKIWLYSIY